MCRIKMELVFGIDKTIYISGDDWNPRGENQPVSRRKDKLSRRTQVVVTDMASVPVRNGNE